MGTTKSNCDDYYAMPQRSLFQANYRLPLWLSQIIPIYTVV
jgi:hypothetical protein